jgi:hypothetical protein
LRRRAEDLVVFHGVRFIAVMGAFSVETLSDIGL